MGLDPGIFGFDVRDREVEWMKEVRCFVGIHGRVQVYFGVPRIKDMHIATWMTIPKIMSLGPVLCFHVDDKIMQLQAAFERISSLEMFYDTEDTASQSTATLNQIVNPLKMVRLLKSKWKSSKIERRRMMLPKNVISLCLSSTLLLSLEPVHWAHLGNMVPSSSIPMFMLFKNWLPHVQTMCSFRHIYMSCTPGAADSLIFLFCL
ncbi:hypothetical protein YC2023_055524 [Brassica napus]